MALIVWLWGVAFYLIAYYAAMLIWGYQRLYELLGEKRYNALIPVGGWRPALFATIVFLVSLVIVSSTQRLLATAAERLSKAARLPRRASTVACNLALVALAVPAAHVGVEGIRGGIARRIDQARTATADRLWAEARSRDPFYTGEGMKGPVTAYAFETGLGGERLLLDSGGNYRRSFYACLGGDEKEGVFERRGDLVILTPVHSDDPNYAELPNQLREVRWGVRSYLLPDTPTALETFCDRVNAGSEPRSTIHGGVLLREGDWEVRVRGCPRLPEAWSTYLLPAALEGRTVAVADDGTTWVDFGAEHGVRVGMELYLPEAPIDPERRKLYGGDDTTVLPVIVLAVEPLRCRVEYVHSPRLWRPIAPGLVVTSRYPTDS